VTLFFGITIKVTNYMAFKQKSGEDYARFIEPSTLFSPRQDSHRL
jgi:hypothetical protein